MKLVLGSTSIYRKQILENAGFAFETARPEFDEDAFKRSNPSLTPLKLCEALAQGKAQSLVSKFPDAVILGCDQLVDLHGEILGKSHTLDGAITQLQKMSGATHLLYCSSAVIVPGEDVQVLTTTTAVTFRDLTRIEIERYVALEQPTDCAGSYKMEKAGLVLAKKILGPDPSAIQGLSLIDLCNALKNAGLTPMQFWKGPQA